MHMGPSSVSDDELILPPHCAGVNLVHRAAFCRAVSGMAFVNEVGKALNGTAPTGPSPFRR